MASRRSDSSRSSISLNVSASSPASEVGSAPGIRSPGLARSTRRARSVSACSGPTIRRSSSRFTSAISSSAAISTTTSLAANEEIRRGSSTRIVTATAAISSSALTPATRTTSGT